MTEVIGVRFRTAGKIYYFNPMGIEVKRGAHVVVETARGLEMGTVVMPTSMVEDEKIIQPLKPIVRVATAEDIEKVATNKAKEKSAFQVCKEKIRKHELDMKLIDAEYTFDGSKLLFYFTADGRIDFRELVKDLASVFRTRIELRQIGVRDETKILGGMGICGRCLCCHCYLCDFAPVSIKMAKEQNLSLNPTKISGTCGRLMCCLKNEEDTYEELNRKLPSVNDYVTLPDGTQGQVQSTDVLRQRVSVIFEKGDEKELMEFPVEEISFKPRKGKKKADPEHTEETEHVGNEKDNSRGGASDKKEKVPGDSVRSEQPKKHNKNHNKNKNRNFHKDGHKNDSGAESKGRTNP